MSGCHGCGLRRLANGALLADKADNDSHEATENDCHDSEHDKHRPVGSLVDR